MQLFGGGNGGEGVEGGIGEGGGEMWEDFHDFGDLVSSQSEINRLRSELGRLQVECQHWKLAAQEVREGGREGAVCTMYMYVCIHASTLWSSPA